MTASGRNSAIDVLRGVGILLVVYAHAARGVFNAGLYENTDMFETIDKLIYSFHMPLFFFLSGLVFAPRLTVPLGSFVKSTSLRLLWPLFLWTYVFLGLQALAGSQANDPIRVAEFPMLPLPPVAHFWFLWALFLIHLFSHICLAAAPRANGSRTFALALVCAFCLLALVPLLPDTTRPYLRAAVLHLPYFALGLLCSGLILRRHVASALGGIGAMAFIAAVFLLTTAPQPLLIRTALTCTAVLGLTCAVATLERGLSETRLWTVLQIFGLASMAIYLTHSIFSAGIRIALARAEIVDTNLHLLIGTAIGIALPILLWQVTRGHRSAQLLGFA